MKKSKASTDKQRLDWLQRNEADALAPWVVSSYRWNVRDPGGMFRESYGLTLRQAIDAAMREKNANTPANNNRPSQR